MRKIDLFHSCRFYLHVTYMTKLIIVIFNRSIHPFYLFFHFNIFFHFYVSINFCHRDINNNLKRNITFSRTICHKFNLFCFRSFFESIRISQLFPSPLLIRLRFCIYMSAHRNVFIRMRMESQESIVNNFPSGRIYWMPRVPLVLSFH